MSGNPAIAHVKIQYRFGATRKKTFTGGKSWPYIPMRENPLRRKT